MILVLAGTTEGKELALELQHRGYAVLTTVATDYGQSLLHSVGIKQVICTRLKNEMWEEIFSAYNVSTVVDATHPYAVEVTKQAISACGMMKIPYIRMERPTVPLPKHEFLHTADTLEEAVELAFSKGNSCFSTMGSKHLGYMMERAKQRGVQVLARVLPDPGVLEKCINLGIKKSQIIAMQGPVSSEINAALYKHYQPAVVLTKESGINGGFREKIEPALNFEIPVVVWQRPRLDYPVCLTSIKEVLSKIRSQELGVSSQNK
ncbi:MAG: precorrin-6A reductase [Firmicutes bacterium]|nr:precorrin-6A reductase [Bacillota bacterium]